MDRQTVAHFPQAGLQKSISPLTETRTERRLLEIVTYRSDQDLGVWRLLPDHWNHSADKLPVAIHGPCGAERRRQVPLVPQLEQLPTGRDLIADPADEAGERSSIGAGQRESASELLRASSCERHYVG
jgi:hypothetical protein